MAEKFSEHENLIIQSYMNFNWLAEMDNLKFVESPEYKQLNFIDKFTQNSIAELGLINQGFIPVAFYIMLVIPRETIFNLYKEKYEEINLYIAEKLSPEVETTYSNDTKRIDFLRHIRNAVSHMNFEMTTEVDYVVFKDENPRKNEKFRCKFSNLDLGKIMQKLREVHFHYIENIKKRYTS
ncbi:HEPN family nuclease [Acinetobacter baumannii]|nr:HEPN family nuclease [Acinetobacter baumannii]